MCFTLRLHTSAAPPRVGLTQALGPMRALILALTAIICGCNLDVVERHYANLEIAKGKTWLPESILPPSTRDIDEQNNLDLNISSGEFHFSSSDATAFFDRLSSNKPSKVPFENWEEIVGGHIKDGGYVRYYQDQEGLDWAFFCAPSQDHCHFDGWLRR
jgi:hypothetical protein